MRLYVEPMDTVVIDVAEDGCVRYEGNAEWFTPSLQERRAIIYAAEKELAALAELLDVLNSRQA